MLMGKRQFQHVANYCPNCDTYDETCPFFTLVECAHEHGLLKQDEICCHKCGYIAFVHSFNDEDVCLEDRDRVTSDV